MPVEVVRRADPSAVAGLLASVPEWFGIPEANAQYVADAGRLPSYLAVDGDEVVGVALLAEHFPGSRELHLLAVRRDRHRQGIGRLLVETVVADLRAGGGAAARGAHRRAVPRGRGVCPDPRVLPRASGSWR